MRVLLAATLSILSILGLFRSHATNSVKPASPVADFPKKVGHPPFLSPHASPIASYDGLVFVANTPSDTVDVIDAETRKIIRQIDVGVDPVSVAVRPDGNEIWVANHVSDSVSVIDNAPQSPTRHHVIATVQNFDPEAKATRFDEPVGIAFAGNDKAYVALSSENEIAVIDVGSRKIIKRLKINAQDPRAIVVRDERLYVIPFESNNQTQLSGGREKDIDGDLVTFDVYEHSVHHNNILSLGHVTDIVKHSEVPDRDLYVFDTRTDHLIKTVDTLGTLLYGIAVDSHGRVYLAQTDARNDINGRSGTEKHSLTELDNRAFLNRVTTLATRDEDALPAFFDLEPLPPLHPAPGEALATPFAIQVSEDDSTLVVSAAGSDKIVTIDTETGDILGRVEVGAVPRGIALESDSLGSPSRAWVLNAVGNTVSLVDLSTPSAPDVKATIELHDPTPPVFKRGRLAFNTAKASTTETFSCASCHPDGHTDQLLWVLKTPIVSGGDQIMPRSTMPVRGLRDTQPFHWDGIPGDPYGGNNSANISGHVAPNATIGKPETATRHLVDGSLSGTMMKVGSDSTNDEAKAGALSAAERDDLAQFLLHITYPPAQKRSYTNELSDRAEKGFELFHIIGNEEGKPQRNVCGDCHRMPHWVSTNTPGSGMDTPTWRGAYDRFLILPQGRLNVIGLDFYHRIAEKGIPERDMWRLSWRNNPEFDAVWDMVLEGSTGYSGSFARQITLNQQTQYTDLLAALERSAAEGGIVLQGEGILIDDSGHSGKSLSLQYDGSNYIASSGDHYSRGQLVSLASQGAFVGTFTGRHGENADYQHPQPALWTRGEIHSQRGSQQFPILFGETKTMKISGRYLQEGAHILVDGRTAEGSIDMSDTDHIDIALADLPTPGLHFLQVQNPGGLFSNDFIFHVAASEAEAMERQNAYQRHRPALFRAIAKGETGKALRLIQDGASLDGYDPDSGLTPLSAAAFHGKGKILTALLDQGANATLASRDGNTPLHTAAFLCRTDLVNQLLENGATTDTKNQRGETPIDVVTSEWSRELVGFYRHLDNIGNLGLDLEAIRHARPEIMNLLKSHHQVEVNKP